MKKFYIRRTHQDVLAEQNTLLKRLLSQHEVATMQAASRPVQEVQVVAPAASPTIEDTKSVDFDFDFDDGEMYIPNITTSSSQLNVPSSTVAMNMENVDKLKKKSKSKKGKNR
jgi:hypothetical protein